MDGNIPYLSVVIPFYNEEESVGIVCSAVSEHSPLIRPELGARYGG